MKCPNVTPCHSIFVSDFIKQAAEFSSSLHLHINVLFNSTLGSRHQIWPKHFGSFWKSPIMSEWNHNEHLRNIHTCLVDKKPLLELKRAYKELKRVVLSLQWGAWMTACLTLFIMTDTRCSPHIFLSFVKTHINYARSQEWNIYSLRQDPLLFFLYVPHTVTAISSSHKPRHSVWSTNCMSDGASLHDESLTLRFVLWCQF